MSDFEIEISGGGPGGYRITARSAAGETAATAVEFPLDDRALERALAELEMAMLRSQARNRRTASELERPVRDLGQQLFDFILPPPELRAHWSAARQDASARDEQLRMRLRIGPAELLALPWEVLYDSSRDAYLSLSSPVVRSLDVFEPHRPLEAAPPLLVLAMAAEPAGLDKLDVQKERRLLGEALASLEQQGRVRVTWVQGQTWRDLQEALDKESWHILHFVGHGSFDRRSGEGFIALANDEGGVDELPASDLGTILAEKSSLRLVVLNSCEGARGSTTDRFSSTASVLLRRGIPAVVAMQYVISDEAATAFAQGFYTALAGRLPIERAVTRARLAIKRTRRNSVEWATPVLYLRSTAGNLFDITHVSTPEALSAPEPGPRPPRWWRRRTVLIAAAAAVVAVIAGLIVATTNASPVPGDVVFSDDFSGPSLDARKWRAPQYPDNTYQRDGHLVLSVRPDKEVDYGLLETQPLSRPFTDATFTVTVLPAGQSGDGGGSFVVNGGGPQPQILGMGPTTRGGVYVDPLTCDKPSCRIAIYEDFTQPAFKAPPMAIGEAVPVEIARKDGHLTFSAKGVELGRTRADPGTLDAFWFAVSSGRNDSWDVQIDDLIIR